MQLGLYTFADMIPDPGPGQGKHGAQRLKEVLEEVKLADDLGLDVFAVGEHHRPEYSISAPAVVLGAAAAITKKIRLSSAVTVLGSDDPVRVFQAFATVDLLSEGRAEIMVGRGSFIESFPLFGYDLSDYDDLFAEKLELLLDLNKQTFIRWKGKFRAPIANRGVYPRPLQESIPVWLAVGGTPSSAVRAGTLGLPMALAIIGGTPDRFVPFTDLYKDSYKEAKHQAGQWQLGINSIGYLSGTSQQAGNEFFGPYSAMMNKIGVERGWPPMTRDQFDFITSPKGSLLVGSPQQVIDKILYEHQLFGNTRFLLQTSVGAMPHSKIMRSIELFGSEVVPVVRKELGQ